MITWRLANTGIGSGTSKRAYAQRYEKTLMRWGSGLFWIYSIQCILGVLLSLGYILLFDTGTPTIGYLWWETSHGSFLVRLHSEFGNLVFFFLYLHVMTKLWTSVDAADADSYITWVSGTLIFVFSYLAGVTGAIMPCSILGEVTATITGSAISSLVYVKFDFLEVLLVPGMALNEEAIWRTYVVHACVPLLTLMLGFLHMLFLHKNKYSGAGGFKRLAALPRFRETRRWRYANRYWSRASGFWLRLAAIVLFFRLGGDLGWPGFMVVSYSFSNFDYWPINDNIDFVLAVPHWYLRPLMGALVTIPHHYLGFIYIGMFFGAIALVPWLNEGNDDSAWGFPDAADTEGYVSTRWDTTHTLCFSAFLFGAMFTTAIVPTGKYFINVGSMDNLVASYWYAILYIFITARVGFYVVRLFFSGFYI